MTFAASVALGLFAAGTASGSSLMPTESGTDWGSHGHHSKPVYGDLVLNEEDSWFRIQNPCTNGAREPAPANPPNCDYSDGEDTIRWGFTRQTWASAGLTDWSRTWHLEMEVKNSSFVDEWDFSFNNAGALGPVYTEHCQIRFHPGTVAGLYGTGPTGLTETFSRIWYPEHSQAVIFGIRKLDAGSGNINIKLDIKSPADGSVIHSFNLRRQSSCFETNNPWPFTWTTRRSEPFWKPFRIISFDGAQVTSPSTTTSTMTLTTSTKTTSTTTTTVTVTTTVTLAAAQCSGNNIRCYLPTDVANGSWSVDGSAETCVQPSGVSWFDVNTSLCHATLEVDEANGVIHEMVSLRLTRANSVISHIVLKESDDVVVTCTCESPLSGVFASSVQHTFESGEVQHEGEGGTYNFDAFLHVFENSSFSAPISSGESFPPDATRMHWQLATANQAVFLGLERCVAAPSNAINDPLSVEIVDTTCSSGTVDLQIVAENMAHVVRFSTLMFKFSSTDSVWVWCEAVRCTVEPCGVCDASGRRLQSGATERQWLALGQSQFKVSTGPSVLTLPGPGMEEHFQTIWVPDQNMTLLEAAKPLIVQLNFLGQIQISSKYLASLAHACSTQMTSFIGHPTRVVQISALRKTGRRLQGRILSGSFETTHSEGLAVKCAVNSQITEEKSLVESKLDASLSGGFVSGVRNSMQQQGFVLPPQIQVSATVKAAGENVENEAGAGPEPNQVLGMNLDGSTTVITILGALVIGVGLAVVVFFVVRRFFRWPTVRAHDSSNTKATVAEGPESI